MTRVSEIGYPSAFSFSHHQLDAPPPVLPEPTETVLEHGVRRVEEVAEDVDVAPLGLRVELGRWDHAHAETLPRGDRLGRARERVVIGERLDPHPTLGGALDELGGLVRPVGAERVRVQIDGVTQGHRFRAVNS